MMMHVNNEESTSEKTVRISEATQKVLFVPELNSINILLATAIIKIENARGAL